MTDPQPLTDDELTAIHEHPAYVGYSVDTKWVRRLVATVEQVRKERDAAHAVIQDAAWQFNEAVSLLREARAHVAPATSLLADIDEGLPAIQEALVALARAVPAAETGEPDHD